MRRRAAPSPASCAAPPATQAAWSLQVWLSTAGRPLTEQASYACPEPLEARPTCIVRGCFNQRVNAGLCGTHTQQWDREKRVGATRDPEQWAR